ncbi:gas vesicle protein GvpG [Micromonospora sp. NPDC005367]|uniref:gas vesicle protein GvpG n=1 Tax=Micromonospora sp. NPDC005367 TaxID=3155590 RepID=UPI0033A4F6A8
MDILWTLLTLPYAPMRGLTAVVKVIAREAEAQRYDPANIRRELEELDAAVAAGELTPAERDVRQQQVLERLTGRGLGTSPADRRESAQAGRVGASRRDAPVVRRSGSRRGGPRPVTDRARRTDAEWRRDGGGGVRDGADPRRRRPNPPA